MNLINKKSVSQNKKIQKNYKIKYTINFQIIIEVKKGKVGINLHKYH